MTAVLHQDGSGVCPHTPPALAWMLEARGVRHRPVIHLLPVSPGGGVWAPSSGEGCAGRWDFCQTEVEVGKVVVKVDRWKEGIRSEA